MSKYLRTVTKINGLNQKVILQVDRCNDCPMLKFHQQSCIATCRLFDSEQGNVLDDFVLNYNVNTGEIHDDIETPKWCRLADLKNQLDFDNKTYTIHNDRVLSSDAIVDDDLPVINAFDATESNDRENKELDINELLPTLVATSVFSSNTGDLTPDQAYEKAYDEYDDYEDMGFNGYGYSQHHTPPKNKHGICSLCGEEDETVNRNTNHGVCDECWKVSHDNDEKKKQAFINNFRIKRGEDFKMETFNLSVLKSDSLKVKISV